MSSVHPHSRDNTDSTKIYIYLVISENGPDGGRIVTSRRSPQDLVLDYEGDHSGWYVKNVWSATCADDAVTVVSAIKAANPGRQFA